MDAYNKFLQLVPNDPKVPQVKAVLAMSWRDDRYDVQGTEEALRSMQ